MSKKALAITILALLPLLYFYPVITGAVALLQGDGWKQNFPLRALAGEMWRAGTPPLWNPYVAAGAPLLASVYPGVLYPPNWLFIILPPLLAMHLVVITTYHLALIGSYLYARRIGLGRLSSIVTGVVFTFSAFMVAHLEQTCRIAAAAWLPWILLAIECLYRRSSWKWIALGAVFISLQLFAGEPQMNLYTAGAGGAYLLFSIWRREERERRRRFLSAVLIMTFAGLLLSSAQLFPEWELLKMGDRSRISYEYFSNFSYPPKQILTLLFPYFFGGAAVGPYSVVYWGEWNIMTTSCYAGALGLLLALTAIFSSVTKKTILSGDGAEAKGENPQSEIRSLVYFWAAAAIVALALSFGSYLPFGINRLLWRLPGYNLFRGSYRHFLEFDFAIAVLAGIGMRYLQSLSFAETGRGVRRACVALSLFFIGGVATARFGAGWLTTTTARPGGATSLGNPEILIPTGCMLAGLIAIQWYARRRSAAAAAFLLAVLLLDLGSFGQFYYWRIVPAGFEQRVADPPTVKFIKGREADLSSFRIMSHHFLPYEYHSFPPEDANYESLDTPNVSALRGLQSVNNCDLLRPPRPAALAGMMNGYGIAEDPRAFGLSDYGLDLLNVKYLLLERRGPQPTTPAMVLRNIPASVDRAPDCKNLNCYDYFGFSGGKEPAFLIHDGIRFSYTGLGVSSAERPRAELEAGGYWATDLALVSNLGNSIHLGDGTVVARIKFHTDQGTVIERELLAGRDTAEWAYDRADVRDGAKHRRATVAEDFEAEGFRAHLYLARLSFERSRVTRVEIEFPRQDAQVLIARASLFDSETQTSLMLNQLRLPPERWRLLERFGAIEIYENLRSLPRAWFVSELKPLPDQEALRVIKEGRFKDGGAFDPGSAAIISAEDFDNRLSTRPIGVAADARVRVTDYQPLRIELETDHSRDSFLILSEIHYPGWEARIDGVLTKVERANYALRGVAVPAGKHRIVFRYLAPSFRAGLILSGVGIVLLIACPLIIARLNRLFGGDSP